MSARCSFQPPDDRCAQALCADVRHLPCSSPDGDGWQLAWDAIMNRNLKRQRERMAA